MSDLIESIQIVNRFLSLCRGYVEEAVFTAFGSLGLSTLLKAPMALHLVANELGVDPDLLKRFLAAAASLGLVEELEGDVWVSKQFKSASFFWKELHAIFKENGEADFSTCSAAAKKLLIQNGVLVEIQDGVHLNPKVESFFSSHSNWNIAPLIYSYANNSAPKMTGQELVTNLSGQSKSAEVKPFSGAGWNLDRLESFLLAMHHSTAPESAHLMSQISLPIEPYSVLDVGGAMATAAAGFHSRIRTPQRTVVYDRATSIELLQRLHKGTGSFEVEFIGGDFFEEASSGGLAGLASAEEFDFITLGWILHDWSDRDCINILKKVAMHLSSGGKVCILECVLPNNRRGEVTYLDVTMMLQTEGNERTLQEYDELALQAGLKRQSYFDVGLRRQMIVYCKDQNK